MTNNLKLNIDLKNALNKLNKIVEGINIEMPSIRIECLTASDTGPLEVLLAGWGNGQWIEKEVGVLQPGETMNVKLNPIKDFYIFKTGETLLLRPKIADKITIFRFTNLENDSAYLHTVTPPKYPWWQGTTVVKWGPSNPYVLLPGKPNNDYLMENWQDVIYYTT